MVNAKRSAYGPLGGPLAHDPILDLREDTVQGSGLWGGWSLNVKLRNIKFYWPGARETVSC